jgi:hypothetical protein
VSSVRGVRRSCAIIVRSGAVDSVEGVPFAVIAGYIAETDQLCLNLVPKGGGASSRSRFSSTIFLSAFCSHFHLRLTCFDYGGHVYVLQGLIRT